MTYSSPDSTIRILSSGSLFKVAGQKVPNFWVDLIVNSKLSWGFEGLERIRPFWCLRSSGWSRRFTCCCCSGCWSPPSCCSCCECCCSGWSHFFSSWPWVEYWSCLENWFYTRFSWIIRLNIKIYTTYVVSIWHLTCPYVQCPTWWGAETRILSGALASSRALRTGRARPVQWWSVNLAHLAFICRRIVFIVNGTIC